ncbi:MAG: hypothetical protein F4110_15190 [Acidimicrobiaceae bacterium]|nr:hypothetical protein [Acidimicrobiaceae bacterium]MXZ98675.1 hypothetical protein [Acidimicrobiaceae bacterium]MYE75797.1 hypothetical protein [Acidimicrobiaceae bacterium]MYI55297.1 hypothetical protein [Acidimicrobiaceae bacterium]MYJ42007.1 hypothetical protein [Acidimicrobiaceae bacterium]
MDSYRGDIVVTAPVTSDEPLEAAAMEAIIERATEFLGGRGDVTEFLVTASLGDASLRLDFSMVGLSGAQPQAASAIERIVGEVLAHAGVPVLGRVETSVKGGEVPAFCGPTIHNPTAEAVLVAP